MAFRVIAENIVGSEPQIDATTIRITGPNATGEIMILELILNSPTAVIFVDGGSALVAIGATVGRMPGTVYPVVIDNRLYLPFCYVLAVFGIPFDVELINGVKTFLVNP